MLQYKPDLVFIEFVINDMNGSICPSEYVKLSSEGIVRAIKSSLPNTDIVFIYLFQKGEQIAARKGRLNWVSTYYEKIADHYSIPSIDVITNFSLQTDKRINDLLKDSCHPTVEGNEKITNIILQDFISILNAESSTGTMPDPIEDECWQKGQVCNIVPEQQIEGPYELAENFCHKGIVRAYVIPFGSKINISFEGIAIALNLICGPDSGFLKCVIDDKEYDPIKIFDPWCGMTRNTYKFIDGNLENKKHQASFRIMQVIPDKSAVLRPPKSWPSKVTLRLVDYMVMNQS